MTGVGTQTIAEWPDESREAAQIVIDSYGEPDEATDSQLTWFQVGEWKRVTATKAFFPHSFPVPHIDCVTSYVNYTVPVESLVDLGRFDGSVMVDRTAGEISARCHDEQANRLALNLADDIMTGHRSVDDARSYYGEEFLNVRRKRATPYMDELRFVPGIDTGDPDQRLLSDDDLETALREGNSGG